MEAVPIAVGSIGQVHRASLRDGTEVVVKVQRRGLDELLECDTAIIRQLMLRFGNSAGQGDSAARMVSDFLNDVQSELDYELEANNLQRFAWQFQHDTKTRVPRVVLSHSARHVLTTTYEPGTKLADVSGHTPQAAAAAQSLAKSLLRQIFCFGFFHADPHADNVIAAPDGAIGFYDLGLVGELCVGERECMNSLLLGLLQGNLDATTAALVQLAGSPEALDVAALRPDLQMFIESHRPAYASSVQVTHLLADILRITTKHRLSLPRGFYLAFKALATVDSVGRKLDPAFDLIAVALPLLRRNQSSAPPQAAGPGHLFSTGAEPLWQIQDFSAAMRTTLLQLSQGQLKLQFEHPGLADAAICYERANSRLALALFTAFITLGGYGLLCCFVLAKLATQRQAIAAAVLLALFSGTVVFLIHRFTAYGGKSRGRRRDR
jgi:ubiquinone biosynthesis protein